MRFGLRQNREESHEAVNRICRWAGPYCLARLRTAGQYRRSAVDYHDTSQIDHQACPCHKCAQNDPSRGTPHEENAPPHDALRLPVQPHEGASSPYEGCEEDNDNVDFKFELSLSGPIAGPASSLGQDGVGGAVHAVGVAWTGICVVAPPPTPRRSLASAMILLNRGSSRML